MLDKALQQPDGKISDKEIKYKATFPTCGVSEHKRKKVD